LEIAPQWTRPDRFGNNQLEAVVEPHAAKCFRLVDAKEAETA